jgi:hypothetical protein
MQRSEPTYEKSITQGQTAGNGEPINMWRGTGEQNRGQQKQTVKQQIN